MFDLTIGELGKVLKLNLLNIDQTVSPPVSSPLNLTGAAVILQFTIGELFGEQITERAMTIVDPINGIVSYVFQPGDLVAPSDFNRTGKFQFVIKITFPGGIVLFSGDITTLTIKQKVGT